MPATRSLLKKTLVITAAVVVIFAGLLVGGVRLLDTLAPQYRQALADRIGQRIGADVAIDGIELRWHGNGPVLQLSDVRITRAGQDVPALRLDNLGLQFAFSQLIQGRRLPNGLILDTPKLAMRIDDAGRPRLVHWSRPDDQPIGRTQLRRVREMLRFIRIDNASLRINTARLPGRSADIEDLDATIKKTDGTHLDIDLSAQGPDWFDELSLAARIYGPIPDIDVARFTIQASGFDTLTLAHSQHLLGDALARRLSGGRVSARVEGRWQDRHLDRATADIDVSAIRDSQQTEPLIPGMTATLGATGDSETPVRFALETIDGNIPNLDQLELSGTANPGKPQVSINARHLPGALTLRLARLRFAALDDTDIQADIDSLSLDAGRDTALKIAFDFTDLQVAAPRFGFGPVAGRYYQQAGNHVLQFDNASGTLSVKRFLRGQLAIDDLGGQLSWRRDADSLRLDASKLALAAENAAVTMNGHLLIPDSGPAVADIRADLAAPDATRVLQHVPQAPDLPNRRLRDWLPKAIKAGRLDSGRLELVGPLDRFPFARPQANERFKLTLEGHGVDIAYKPGWPALNQARGKLTLNGDNLRVDIADGEMLGVKLAPSTGTVANVREPILDLDGHVNNGPARKMLAFLEKSPLRDRFGKLARILDVRGPADLSLDLQIPLKPGLGRLQVKGTADAHGVRLNHDALPGPITDIAGRLRFNGDGLHGENLKGNLLGIALQADLTPGAGKSQRIVAHGSPSLPANRKVVANYVPERWLDYAHGQTRLDITLEVARSGTISQIDVDSDLTGLALNLPAPLTKTPETTASVAIQVQPEKDHLTLHYDDRVDLTARLAGGGPTRVQVRLNDTPLEPPDTDGLWLGGHARAIDMPGWYRVVRHILGDPNGDDPDSAGHSLAFIGGNITSDELRFGDRYFENAQIRAQPLTQQPGWRIDFEGPDTQGQITWEQNGEERLTLAGNLKRLALQTRTIHKTPPAQDDESPIIWQGISPLALPALDLYVANFSVDDTSFGETRLQAHALAQGWQLDKLSLEKGALTGNASGQWTRRDGSTRASGQTRLEGHGLARLLATLGYPPAVEADKARIESRLSIGTNPNGLDLRELDGSLSLALDDGQLTSIEPGAARMLGLFNLYILPRRLQLDFGDVVEEGLAFDKVRAQFNIVDGNAYTKGTRIETPSSEISITGRIGLAARDYDERVTIMPKVGSGVAIASTVFGGPLVGAAVLAVQELLKQPIQDASRISYTLKGSWDDPSIAEPDAQK